MSRIAVVGTGYVGLTTAACMASLGHDVVGIDVDRDKVKRLSRADLSILKPGLLELVASGLVEQRIRFSADHGDVAGSEFFSCAVRPHRMATAEPT